MATSSSSLSITIQAKYDVFLSFRGEDTRYKFISHLYSALCRNQIAAFIDDGLKRGDEISSALMEAIKQSIISVIIFSKNYASSRWCLEELEEILQCKKKGQVVIPVFYQVSPSDVRKQSGSFGDAFVTLEKRFKKSPEKVQSWKVALTEASNLSGFDSMVFRSESELVDAIVKDILKKLNDISPCTDFEGLVGINSRIDEIKTLLCFGLPDFRMVGIWGMGGIGKTTIARAVFNQFSSQFDGRCFIENVREESEKRGLVHLRDQVQLDLLGEENIRKSISNRPEYIRRLQRKKVFLVLDDVNKLGQLESLAGRKPKFGPGSRVIITSRDKQLLHSYGINYIYEVEGFKNDEAFQLFCNYAFKLNPPLDEHLMMLSRSIIGYAKGNPLALKVLGSSLYGKSKQEWDSALLKLTKISNPEIHDVLIVSYHELDVEVKDIFLDIACFFKGEDVNEVKKILGSCYISIEIGISVLIDKSLITITKFNTIQMHELLQEMGWEVVRQESPKAPGKRSRLCSHEDALHVLEDDKGTEAVQGLFLDLSKIREDLHLSSKAFENMPNLKFLKFYVPEHSKDFRNVPKVYLLEGLNYLSNELRYLHWHRYPLKKLPPNFSPNKLIELRLPYSDVEQLSVEMKHGSDLRSTDPNYPDARHLEQCQSLFEGPSSSQDLRRCGILRTFPHNIHFRSLVTLDLSDCIYIKEFPQISGNIKRLDLSRTGIEEVPASIACLPMLAELVLGECKNLRSVSTNICKLKSLGYLFLWECSELQSFPEILEKMEGLETLYLDGTAIKELPSSIENLNGLCELGLNNCYNLETLPSSIYNLTSLTTIDLNGSENFGKSFSAILRPSSISCWKDLTQLSLGYRNLTEVPEDFFSLLSLEQLDLRGNNFGSLPTSIKQLHQLRWLYLTDCKMLKSIPMLPLGIQYLDASGCMQLQSLPEPQSNLEELDESELEVLSARLDGYSWTKTTFLFTNCLKLNQNSENSSQQIIQHMANAQLSLCYETESDAVPSISLCLPGSEIPTWFDHKSSGSSITIDLPRSLCNRRLMGFALSVVTAYEDNYCEDDIGIRCNYHFQNNYEEYKWEYYCKEKGFYWSDHIILGYSPCTLREGEVETVIFEFSTFSLQFDRNSRETDYKIKCFGVCPLYEETNMTRPSTSNEIFAATSEDLDEIIRADSSERRLLDVNASGSGIDRTNDEQVELDPNGICRNQVDTLLTEKSLSSIKCCAISIFSCWTFIISIFRQA